MRIQENQRQRVLKVPMMSVIEGTIFISSVSAQKTFQIAIVLSFVKKCFWSQPFLTLGRVTGRQGGLKMHRYASENVWHFVQYVQN